MATTPLSTLLLTDHVNNQARLTGLLRRQTPLPPRLAEVVALDYLGKTRKEMAKQFDVQPISIKVYWTRIYKRLNLTSRAEVQEWVKCMLDAELA